MKKYLSILVVLIFFSLIPAIVLATSGACSYHRGVNCSIGADYRGKVQCNDGWVNSSVYFSDTDECKLKLNNICSLPYLIKNGYGSTDMSLCDQYQKNCDDNNKATYNAILMGGGNPTLSKSCPEADQCRKEVVLNTNAVNLFNKCLDTIKQMQIDTAKMKQEQSDATLKQLMQKNADLICQQNNGNNSYSKDGSCYCSDGYLFDKNSNLCLLEKIVRNNFCSSTIVNSHYDLSVSEYCQCDIGYTFNVNTNQCVKTITPIVTLESKKPVIAPMVKTKLKLPAESPSVVSVKIVKEPIKTTEIITSTKVENNIPQLNSGPVKKVKWYQKIFSWFKE